MKSTKTEEEKRIRIKQKFSEAGKRSAFKKYNVIRECIHDYQLNISKKDIVCVKCGSIKYLE